MEKLTFEISQSVGVDAAIDITYRALIRRITDDSATPDNRPLPLVLEEWPGGRWYRDLGEGQGHLWGFVQVIKPPTLIEIHGPMFMSHAVTGHIQYRLTSTSSGTELSLRHQMLGRIEEAHLAGLTSGWEKLLDETKQIAETGAITSRPHVWVPDA